MKFYYNGNLVRTSKTHEYKFGMLTASGKIKMCSATREGCQKEIDRRISEQRQVIANCNTLINAIERGAKYWNYVDGRHSYRMKVEPDRTIEEERKEIATAEMLIEVYSTQYKVVELEARA